MKLTLGFSPCPNDTFIFDALVHGRIDTEGLEFDYYMNDVEELNRKAFTGVPDITKMSCFAYAFAANDYQILDSGSALGYRNGPLLIATKPIADENIDKLRIAIPGIYTTANLLFSIAWPGALNKHEYIFSDIEDAVLRGDSDAGLVIHESRFTYQKKGLVKIADVGEYWQNLTGLPVPLGVIAINRRVPADVANKVNSLIRKSLEHAYSNSLDSYDFVRNNARELDSTVMNNHIKLYVNKYTLDLGITGKQTLLELFNQAGSRGVISKMPQDIFLNPLQNS